MDEPAAPHQTRADTDSRADGQVLSRTPTSGAKGFAIVLGAMLGIIGLLWLTALLVAPH